MDLWIIVLASLGYLAAGTLAWRSLINAQQVSNIWAILLGLLAVCLHGMLLHQWIDVPQGQNLNLWNMLSLTLWCVALMLLAWSWFKPVHILWVVIFPLATLSLWVVQCFPRYLVINTLYEPHALMHIILSIATFCFLCLAALIALLLALQDYCLRQHRLGHVMMRLPAMESTEAWLFQLLSLGFVLLTVVLVSSLYFYHALLWSTPFLVQKTVLVIAAWLVFLWLLIGRFRWGWRGRTAIYWTLVGFALLWVAYFGSKLILEHLT